MANMQAPIPPNLPVAPASWSARFQDQHSNVLRLYFNQLQDTFGRLVGSKGGQYLDVPNGVFRDSSTQTTSPTSAAVITLATTDSANGVSLVDNSKFSVTQSGRYNVQATLQVTNNDVTAQSVYVWLRVKDVDLADSCSSYTLPAGASFAITYSNSVVLPVNSYFQVVWGTTNANVSITPVTAAESPTRPAVPSAAVSVLFATAA